MKTKKDLGFIRVPNDQNLIPAIIEYADKVSEIVGFPISDRRKIQLAIEEACVNVIKNSFIPDEEAEYDIKFINLLNGIEIHIHDMGQPYDPNLAPVFDPSADIEEFELEGLGSFLISKIMDEYKFNNLGVKGKEIVIVKYFNTELVGNEQSNYIEPEVVFPPESNSPVEQIEFDIQLMKQHEALEVCRCIYDCYGYSYANENIYYPERVSAMNQNGKLRSAVALTKEGEMAGHFALIFYDKLPAEIGIAVTKKKFRGQGFARQLGEFLETEARKLGLNGVQVKEVTAHPYTQKFCIKLGYKDCGLLLAHSPKTLSFKGIADTLKQRNSDVLGFKYLEKPKHRKLYAPSHHQEMIELLYKNIGDDVELIQSENPMPSKEQSVTEVNVHSIRSLAEMIVLDYGPDIIQTMRNEMRKIFMEEIQVIELYLSLKDPFTPVVVPQLEKLGFIFTGVLPETSQGDSLIMQYFNGVHIDYNQIVLVTDVAKKLLDYVKSNDAHAE